MWQVIPYDICFVELFAFFRDYALQNGNLYSLRTDELRMAVKEVICDNEKERLQYEEALVAITVDESLKR